MQYMVEFNLSRKTGPLLFTNLPLQRYRKWLNNNIQAASLQYIYILSHSPSTKNEKNNVIHAIYSVQTVTT